MMQMPPYFMKDEEWYYFDRKEWKYFLTDKAPKKAIDSYNEYYRNVQMGKKGMPIFVDK